MPLASPATEPKRHLQNLPGGCPEWGFAPCGAGMGGVPVPGGGRGGFGRPPAFYFSFVFSPIPPPPFPAGRGRLKVFLCKGLRPLHPPGLNLRGTYRTRQAGARSGALPLAGRGWVAFRYPAGGRGACPFAAQMCIRDRAGVPCRIFKKLPPGFGRKEINDIIVQVLSLIHIFCLDVFLGELVWQLDSYSSRPNKPIQNLSLIHI